MTNKTGVVAKKTKLMDKKVKADYKKIFTVLSKSAIMFYAGKPGNAVKEFAGLIESFKFSPDPADLAYRLIITALVNSAHNLAEENRIGFVAKLENADKLYDVKEYVEFLDGIGNLIDEKEIILEYEMLKNPRSIPIFDDFQQYFIKYLILFGIPENDAKLIGNRLPSYFVFELNDEWRNNFSKYEPLIEALNAPTSEAARKERQWEAYYTYLEREAEAPIFGESFGLNDIFIPLRAYFKKGMGHEENKSAIWLESTMDKWLASSSTTDDIKMIQGGPGSGKSSFVKLWTAKIARERNCPVLFFPLHHFNIHTNIKSAIGEYLKDSDNIPLDFNPLEDTQPFDKLLLVFDGLDELVMQGKSTKEAANSFLQELKDFCRLKNYGNKQKIKIVITGRPIAVQNTETKLRDSEEQIIYLLPYFLREEEQKSFIDPKNILAEDQRDEWWNHFFELKGLTGSNLPKELKNENMDKITTEPLLNYLVALSWKDAPEKFNEKTNINDIYYQLMYGVYHRQWENKRKYRGLGDLSLDDFIQILEEIAICAWQGGDARVTTERKIEKHIKDKGLESLLQEYKDSAKGGVSKLLTAFYFRKYGKEESENKDDTFEFTHKSFGEYLAARALVELIKATHEERTENKTKATSRREKRKGWTVQQCLGEWLRMTGKNSVDNDISNFVFNEIQKRSEDENIEEWQNSLCEIINELVHTGMPIHLQEQRLSQVEEMALARNAEETLLVTLANCAKVTGKLSKIEWGENDKAAIWLRRLSTSLVNKNFAFKNLNHLDFNGMNLDSILLFQANFEGANLNEVVMTVSTLTLGNFKGATFKNAVLGSSIFYLARMNNSDFSYARLTDTDFRGAYLNSAILTNADLEEAKLNRAMLIDANLSDANLTNAILNKANLTDANLTNADLTGANLSKTIVSSNQLLQVKSLYKTRNIPSAVLAEIKKVKPQLLRKPKTGKTKK